MHRLEAVEDLLSGARTAFGNGHPPGIRVVVRGEEVHRQAELLQVVHTGYAPSPFLDLSEHREEQRGQQSDKADDYQQLDERECATRTTKRSHRTTRHWVLKLHKT